MIVVSDTTPLISLLKIERVDLLERLFGQVLIPQAVFDELTADERFKFEADQVRRKQFIKVMACIYDPELAGMAGQAYMDVMGERMPMCFTSEQRAEEADYNADWDVARARDLMNNMFHNQSCREKSRNRNFTENKISFNLSQERGA